MQAIFAVTVPFFALVLAGWLAARLRLLPAAAIPGLNAYVLYFALPCLLLRFGSNTPVLGLLNPAVLLVYLGCALLIVGITVPLWPNRRVGAEGRRVWRAGGGRQRFPTAGSWACRCWWHCRGRRRPGR